MMSPIEYLRRMLPLMRVGFALATVVVVVNSIVVAVAGAYPQWPAQRMAGAGFSRDIAQRINAAESALDPTDGKNRQRLCAILGLSAQREALDLATVDAHDGIDARYLGLCGAGGTVTRIVEDCAPLLGSPLHPDLVVIGLNAHLLVDPIYVQSLRQNTPAAGGPTEPAIQNTIWSAMRRGDARMAARALAHWFWVHHRRRDFHSAIEDELTSLKFATIRAIGGTTDVQANPLKNPWREMIRLEMPDHVSDTALKQQIASYRGRGLFDAQSYSVEGITEHIEDLAGLIQQLQNRGSKVVVVFVPEHTQLRGNVPALAVPRFQKMLASATDGPEVTVLDHRDVLGDEHFADIAHVNASGRTEYSKMVAAIVAEVLWDSVVAP